MEKVARRLLRGDRRRSQRGSVLSGVLIITAFLAILSGALMTELSSGLLISNSVANRVGVQATVSSALELGIDHLQNNPLVTNGCPAAPSLFGGTVSLPSGFNQQIDEVNGNTPSVTYLNCALVPHSPSPQSAVPNPFLNDGALPGWRSSNSFNQDGTRVSFPSLVDEYLVADSGAKLSAFNNGSLAPRWTISLAATLTGPPAAMLDKPAHITNLVPIDDSKSHASCGGQNYCVHSLSETPGSTPSIGCYMPSSGPVSAAPAGGAANQGTAFFGDSSGSVYAYSLVQSDTGCTQQGNSQPIPGYAVVAGPVVFGHSSEDEVYVVASNGANSLLVHFTYSPGSLTYASGKLATSSINLPWPNAVGLALEGNTLPANLAITFAGGQVAVDRIPNGFAMQQPTSSALLMNIAEAPFWTSTGLIGVGGQTGSGGGMLAVLDPNNNLNSWGTYALPAPVVRTPAYDGAGDWYVAAEDGYLYEIQGQGSMALAKRFVGSAGNGIGSSPVVGLCPIGSVTGFCVYFASANQVFLAPLDARDLVLTANLVGTPSCLNRCNPRLWAQVEVGGSNSGRPAVHVWGWSYYSP